MGFSRAVSTTCARAMARANQNNHGHLTDQQQMANTMPLLQCFGTANMGNSRTARAFQTCWRNYARQIQGFANAMNHCSGLQARCRQNSACSHIMDRCGGKSAPTAGMIRHCMQTTHNSMIQSLGRCYLRYMGGGGGGGSRNVCAGKRDQMGAYCISHLSRVYHCTDTLMQHGCQAFCCRQKAPRISFSQRCTRNIMGVHCSRLIRNHGCLPHTSAGQAVRHGCAASCRLSASHFRGGRCPGATVRRSPLCTRDVMGVHCSRLIRNHGCMGSTRTHAAVRHGCARSCRLRANQIPGGRCPGSSRHTL